MSFKDGRIGVGKDPIFPLDISGSCRIDGDLILGGRFSDSQGNAIQLGSGSGATSTPDQNQNGLPSWSSGTISTQGLGVFKGVQDPVKKSLYINGDSAFNMANTTGSYNTTVGYEAGVAITGGGGNVIVGRNAGRYINNGANNVMVGNYAGHAYNSTENVFIGKFSGYANSKSHNVSIGCDTMQQAYPTEYSVAIGYMAGYGAGGENQIYIGREAGKSTSAYNNQTGDDNIGIGAYALNKVTSGRNNVCIGLKSGEDLTTGQYNTCIGSEGGINITSAESNTTVGAYCAPNITTGNYNTIMGVNAGYNITTGTNNVCIGMQSGFSRNFSKCVLLGHDAMCYGTSDVTGTIAIGFQAGYREGSGNRNIYIGQQTGPQGTNSSRTCAENVVMGYQCGYYLTTGNYNTFIGRSAGHQINSGDYNVCLGYYAAVQATSTSDSIIIGRNAGYGLTTASDTIAIGQSALTKITTSANSIGIGRFAGYGITGGQNICIGYHTAYNSTNNTGHNNVFMGQMNGYSITTAYENVCIGREVGYYLTTGFRNIFMGTYAGYASSSAKNTGNYNVGIGYNALRYVSSGSENICIGYSCGESITSGQRNVCLGRTAAQSITTGGYNVCIGMQTGDSITTANSNVFIGYQAGEKITTHAANTFIGAQAGCYMTSGYNNVCIGHYAGASSGGGNYELYINSYVGSYGTDSFIYGNMNMSSNPYLRLNARLEMYDDDIVFNRRGRGLVGSYATESGNLNPIWTLGTGYTENDGETIPRYSIGYCYPNACDVPGDTNHKWGLYVDATAYGSPDWLGYANWFLSGGKGGYSYMQSGRFGIGVTSPSYPLQVNGGVFSSTGIQATLFYARYNAHASSQNTYTNTNISVKCENGLWATHLFAQSDIRIKENIIDVPDNLALEMVRNIPCRYYDYKDKIGRGKETTIGFIAQEVKEILPMAVGNEKHFIPNELRNLENISWDNNKLTTNLQDVSGVKYRFYVSNEEDNSDEVVKEIIGNTDNTFTFDSSYNNVFCYGKEVDDFHTLDKQKLFTLNFSATQELDKKVTVLETVGNKDHNVKILNLYKENEALKARLAKIEAFLGI